MPLPRYDNTVYDNVPRPVPGASIAILTQPAVTTTEPGSPLATIYSDAAGSVPLANPFDADGTGNFFFYAAAGTYTVQIYGGTLANAIVLADQALGTPAAGITLKTDGVTNSSQILFNLVAGTNVTVTEVAGAVTIDADAASVALKTNGTSNSTQVLLDITQGTGITVAEAAGVVTITNSNIQEFQTNGVDNGSQALLNLKSGTNATVTDDGVGGVTIDAAWPLFENNTVALTAQSPVDFTNGNNIQVSNPSAGVVKFDAISVAAVKATIDLTGQGATISATTLYTPTATGYYRVSAYTKVTTVDGVSSTLGAVTITYTDGTDSVAQSQVMGMMKHDGSFGTTNTTNTTAAKLNGSIIIYAKTGVAIQYAVPGYLSNTASQMKYELHLKCEAL